MASDDSVAQEVDSTLVEAELARHRDDLRLILDAIPAFVFYKDTQNRILRVNRAAAESLGVLPDDMVNSSTTRWYPDEADAYYADDLVVMRSRQPKLGIVERLESSGDKRWVQTDKFPQFDAEGRVVGIVVIAQDITDRRQLEQQLLQAQKLDSIGRLAGGVAHDFNNLLTTIFGHLDLARRKLSPDSPVADHLDTVRLAAVRGADLTKQLLTFARRQVIKPRHTDLNGLLQDADRLLRRVIDESIELCTVPAPGPLSVLIDPGQMSQVILNMALNARDAMPDGGVLTLSTGKTRIEEMPTVAGLDRAPGLYAVLTISDTGHGLTDDAKQHLFEPFFTTKPLGNGTGLGLATCYGMIKQNKGHITVESEPGRGTSFAIFLPIATERTAAQIAESAAMRAARNVARVVSPPLGQQRTALLVEDDEPLRLLVGRMLAEDGYHIISASNGEEALSLALRHPGTIDVLVADVVMPRLGGPALAARLKLERPFVRVLYISGYSDGSTVKPIERADEANLLAKPFTAADLLRSLDNVFAAERAMGG